jgi:hypothetical protein
MVRTPQENVEADAARRDDAARRRIERGDAADRKAVAPVRVGQSKRRLHDPGQARHVAHLLAHLVVHGADQGFVGEDRAGHAHAAGGRDLPFGLADPVQLRGVHPSPTRSRSSALHTDPMKSRAVSSCIFSSCHRLDGDIQVGPTRQAPG